MRKLHPAWNAGIASVAYLLTLPLMGLIYASQIKKAGMFYVEILFSVWVVFPLLMLAGYLILKTVIQQIDSSEIRTAILALCASAIMAWHGMPGWFAMLCGAGIIASIYSVQIKTWNDAVALERFDADSGRVDAPPGFLAQFGNPLWRVAGLTETRAVSIVEGVRQGYPFTVLELEHRSMKLTQDRGTDITTVFILKLDRSSDHWQNNVFHGIAATVWVAAGMATNVQHAHPAPAPRPRTMADQKMQMLWLVVAGMLPALEWMSGLAITGQAVLASALHGCLPSTGYAAPLSGHNQVMFGFALCLPLIGQVMGLQITNKYYGREGYTWRICANGVLVVALAFAGMWLAFECTKIDPAGVQPLLCGSLRK